MELLDKLGINWSLLLAQAVNFFLILGILAYLVYKPVLRVLDERSARIKQAMDDAAKIESQKRDMDDARRAEFSKIDREAGDILAQAKDDAEKKRQEILANAQREAAEIMDKAREVIAAERVHAYNEVKDDIGNLIVKLTQKILEREFTPEDQRRLVTSLEKEIPQRLS